MVMTDGNLDRLSRLLERNGQSSLAADLRSRGGESSSGSGSSRAVTSGGLQAGTAPDRFGTDRNGAPVTEIEAAELYAVFDPVGLQFRWSIGEVARVVTALPDLRLP